jgi:antitoxin HicB
VKKDIDYYMGLKYKIVVTPTEDSDGNGFLLEIPELGRLSTYAWGETYDEAYAVLKEIQRDNIQDLIDKKLEVPEPAAEEGYSGRLNLRMPKTLHRRLAEIAREEETSLNSLIVNMLHENIGSGKIEELIEALRRIDVNFNVMHQHSIVPQKDAEEVRKRMKKVVPDINNAEFAKAG